METWFAMRVRERMEVLGETQDKYLAATLAETTGLSLSNVQSKLSKLFGGDREARQQLLRDDRVSAWTSALKVGEDTIPGWLAESDARVALVLDPRLPEAGQRYVREHAGGVRYGVAEAPPADLGAAEVDSWLRDTAKALENHNPLLVLADLKRRDFFAGADLRFTTVSEVALGWQLHGAPELLPLREPPPPQAFDECGRRLTTCEHLAKQGGGRTAKMIRRGEVPTFPLEQALPHLIAKRGLVYHPLSSHYHRPTGVTVVLRVDAPGAELVETRKRALDGDAEVATLLWEHDGRYYAFGPRAEKLRGLFELHEDAGCHAFALSQWIEDERLSHNPWRDQESEWWRRAREEVTELGVALDPFLASWRESAGSLAERDDVTRLLVGAELKSAQAIIRELALRPVRGPHWLPLQLDALADAKLLERPRAPGEALHVVGDLGAGRLLALRVLRFDAQAPTAFERAVPTKAQQSYGHPPPPPFEGRDAEVFDGGDVRIRLTHHYDPTLEGTARVARARQEAEERQRDDAWDDDD